MKKLLLLLVPVLALGVAAPSSAGPDDGHMMTREQMRDMSPEERQAAHERRRAEWEALSPEEQAAMRANAKERRAERRERMENMSPEQKQKMRDRMKEKRGAGKPHGPHGG